ncbi:unnamed protein product [Rotaria sp. Silwood1]|nr:unnamed protein product [Rotaria sp. Silwood1]
MTMGMQFGSESRFTDLYNEPVDYLLSPIKGYQDKPLVSLPEAIEPVTEFFNEIEDNVFVALHNCQNPADGLAQQESASIHLYTMQFSGGPSLYLLLNRSLRAENREELKPWFSYLKLFLTALYKLSSQSGIVWRGIRDVDLSSKYKKGTKFAWWGVNSCTVDIEVLESHHFLGKHGKRTLFSIECINGKSVTKHSYFKNTEKEVILMPGSYFEVMGHLNPAPDLHIIQLKEMTPPIALIKPPFSKSNELNFPAVAHKSSKCSSSMPTMMTPTKPVNNVSNKMPSVTSNSARWSQNAVTVAGGHGKGGATNQLYWPYGLFIDDDQTVVIADYYNHRIVKWKIGDTKGQVLVGDNGQGNRLDQLYCPRDVLMDKETDSLIICDSFNQRVVRWSRRDGTSHGEILVDNIDCWGLAMDDQRYLYISDTEKHEVRRYQIGDKNGTIVAGGYGEGAGLNQLNGPTYIFVDRQQAVYVSDNYNHRVMKWNKDAKEGIVVAGGEGIGKDLTKLSYPNGLFVDMLGTIYVTDCNNDRVMRWPEGKKQGTIIVGGNGYGEGANQLNGPTGLSFDQHGNLYITDRLNHRVQRFSIE